MSKIITFFLLIFTSSAHAITWEDLWIHRNQRGQQMFDAGDYTHAFAKFTHPNWKATAAYRAGLYAKAAQLFSLGTKADDFYNLGNAQAFKGEYQQAIDSYTQALKLNPNVGDAKYNREIVRKLLQKSKNNSDSKQQEQKPDDTKNAKDQKSNQQDNLQKSKKMQNKPNKALDDAKSNEQNEKEQSKKQWLNLIPEDPSAFLREKFLRDYMRSKQ